MSLPGFVPGPPGVRATKTATHRIVFYQGDWLSDLGLGKYIDGQNSRDPGNNAPADVNVLRPGFLLGKVTGQGSDITATTNGVYVASIIDVTAGALTAAGTSITLSTAGATELVRRMGSSGTLTLTGPPVAAGVVRQVTVTYSAVVTSTGVVTITAAGVNEVQTLGFTNSPSGTFQLVFFDLNGAKQITAPITYSGTAATLVSNINTAVAAAMGSSEVVASGTAVTAIALTFSGTGYAALPQPNLVGVDVGGMSAGNVSVTRTTAGVDGRMIAGAFVGPTDGAQTPATLVPDGYGIFVTDIDYQTNILAQFPQFPIAGVITDSQIINWPSDTSLQAWIRTSLSTASGGKFVFSGSY